MMKRREVIKKGALASGLAVAGVTALASAADPQKRTDNKTSLDGKIALVTGAARGIGRAISVELATLGVQIGAVDILDDIANHPVPMAGKSDMEKTKELIKKLGSKCLTVQADIRDLAAIKEAVSRIEKGLGTIAILVANAGVNSNVGFLSEDEQAWSNHWDILTDVNVKGTANTVRAALPGMSSRGRGNIIITSSTFGRQGNGSNPAYVASKWGLVGMIKSLAIEAGPFNINLNGIAPTAVRTGLGGPQTQEQRANGDQWLKENYHQLPIGLLEPADIAGAVAFLASDSAKYITGMIIDIAAGANARYTA